MLEYIFLGSGFAFAAAVQPGPLQAFLLTSVMNNGWKKTMPASFAPIVGDIPIALIVLILLKNITAGIRIVLQGAGGILLIYLAWNSYKRWKKPKPENGTQNGKAPKTFFQAVLVNILNPNPYLGWSLILGPALIKAWTINPAYSFVLVASFYLTMIISLGLTIILFGTTGFLNGKNKNRLMFISILLLALLGLYQISAVVF